MAFSEQEEQEEERDHLISSNAAFRASSLDMRLNHFFAGVLEEPLK